MGKSVKIVILCGGTLGNCAATFAGARRKLEAAGVRDTAMSSLFRSRAVDCVPGTPDFCDAALTGSWAGTPEALLELCQKCEREAGRPANHSSRESRTLDLDIVLFGDRIIRTEQLTVPHPRAAHRRFVLAPLDEIAPDLIFPDSGLTVHETLKNLPPEN